LSQNTIKLELIEWLSTLSDKNTLSFLKIIKENSEKQTDWWTDLTDEQKEGIERGLEDVKADRVTSHEDIKLKYGL
jgi:predicted transcriptional regulator